MLVKQHEYECLCLPGYYGEHCEKRPCDNVDCHSRGTCVNLLTSSTCKATAISGWNCDPGTDYRCNCDEGKRGDPILVQKIIKEFFSKSYV